MFPTLGTISLWSGWTPMDYRVFTNDSLTMMYEAVRGALEAEMLRRGMPFEAIDWDDGQAGPLAQ